MQKFDIMLSAIERIKPSIQKLLIDSLGSAQRIFNASEEQLLNTAKLNPQGAKIILQSQSNRFLEALALNEIDYCKRNNITPINATQEQYPKLLREVNDPPHVIYTIGELSSLNKNLISIVGCRDVSIYGQKACNKLIRELAERIEGLVIVSGLAYGIDAAAHRAALEAHVPTIAVLPSPLPNIVPSQHQMLANMILDQGGLLISEHRSTQSTTKLSFLPRNRIIAALSPITVVVESGAKGGSIATAMAAHRYNRIVAAVPGHIDDDKATGCNQLIRSNTASMVTSADDIISLANWGERCRNHTRIDEV